VNKLFPSISLHFTYYTKITSLKIEYINCQKKRSSN